MKKIMILAALTAVVCGATAQSQPKKLSEGANGTVREVIRELLNLRSDVALRDDQQNQIKDIVRSHRSEIAGQFKTASEARLAMRDAVEASGPESVAASKAADAIAISARNRALLVARIATEIRPVLTPEQLKLVKASRERIEDLVDQRITQFAE